MLIHFPLRGLSNCRICNNSMHHSIEVKRCYDDSPNRKIRGGPKPSKIIVNSVGYHCSVCGGLFIPTPDNKFGENEEERLEKAELCLKGIPCTLKPNSEIVASTQGLFMREEKELNLLVINPIEASFGLVKFTPKLKIKVLAINSLCYLKDLYVLYKDINPINFK